MIGNQLMNGFFGRNAKCENADKQKAYKGSYEGITFQFLQQHGKCS